MQLTLLKYANFSHSRDIDNKNLRQQVKQKYGVAVRRLDNFTLCALAAVAELGGDIHHYKKLSLISCAQHFSIELIQQMLLDLQQNHAIKPLDFVATVGNAANFYIAKEFAIDGCNLFVGADKARFRKQVVPGDKLVLKASINTVKRGIWKFGCESEVEGKMVATGEILCADRNI